MDRPFLRLIGRHDIGVAASCHCQHTFRRYQCDRTFDDCQAALSPRSLIVPSARVAFALNCAVWPITIDDGSPVIVREVIAGGGGLGVAGVGELWSQPPQRDATKQLMATATAVFKPVRISGRV
jgi:hypothetical protein